MVELAIAQGVPHPNQRSSPVVLFGWTQGEHRELAAGFLLPLSTDGGHDCFSHELRPHRESVACKAFECVERLVFINARGCAHIAEVV